MRSKNIAGVLALMMAVLMTAPVEVWARDAAQLAVSEQARQPAATAQSGSEPWYARAWQKIRSAFGGSRSVSWTDKALAGNGVCGARGCTCCHSSIMEPRVDDAFVHPGPPGSGEQVNSLYWRSAKAIAQMNATERDAIRKKIRSAISNGDTTAARALIDASLGKP
jgi:hypothetical protein